MTVGQHLIEILLRKVIVMSHRQGFSYWPAPRQPVLIHLFIQQPFRRLRNSIGKFSAE
jgi:hypothetical protein